MHEQINKIVNCSRSTHGPNAYELKSSYICKLVSCVTIAYLI